VIADAVRDHLGSIDIVVHVVGGSSAPQAVSRCSMIASGIEHST
jgi:hypothetical protein